MGVPNLLTYIKENNRSPSAVDADEEIDIVIDAGNISNNLLRRLPVQYDLCSYLIHNIIELLFMKFKMYKMNPVCFVFDGTAKDPRMKTILRRRKTKINKSIEGYEEIKEGDVFSGKFIYNNVPIMNLVMSPSAKYVFADCLKEYIQENNINCEVMASTGEGDLGTARYAKDHDCYVLSNDCDFMLFDIKGLIIYNDLEALHNLGIISDAFFVDRYVYSPEIISKCLNLRIQDFSLFGILDGCDAITYSWNRKGIYIIQLVEIINNNNSDLYKIMKSIYNRIDEEELNRRIQTVKNNMYIFDASSTYEYPYDMYISNDSQTLTKDEFKEKMESYMSNEETANIIMGYVTMTNNFSFPFLLNIQSVINPRLPTVDSIEKMSHFCLDLQRLPKDKYYGETRPFFCYRYMSDIYDVPARGSHMDFFKSLDILLDFINNNNDKEILSNLCSIYGLTNIYENIDIRGNFPVLIPLTIALYCRYDTKLNKRILRSLAYAHFMKHTHIKQLKNNFVKHNMDLLVIKEEYYAIYSTLHSILGILGRLSIKSNPICFSAFAYCYLELSNSNIEFTEPEGMVSFDDWYPYLEHYLLENKYEWNYLDLPSPVEN
ncbi:hypothetical protein WA158_007482 [Blastocystis sp. Blastoise]